MSLKETIRKVLLEETDLPIYIRRRLRPNINIKNQVDLHLAGEVSFFKKNRRIKKSL
jgi:hypothetical protein